MTKISIITMMIKIGNHYRQSFIIKNSNIDNWNKYFDLLNKSLNLFRFREAASLIDEFINLETYLLNEFKSYEKEEKDMNYQSRKELVEFLNRNLQVFTNFFLTYFFFFDLKNVYLFLSINRRICFV